MNVGVVGMGHVGLVTAACMAHVGHDVVGVDLQAEKIEGLQRGSLPFYERHLDELVDEGRSGGRLRFELDVENAVADADVVFICVGTPSRPNGEADLTQIEGLAYEIARLLNGRYKVLVEKSTVPVTTGQRLFRTIRRLGSTNFDVASNPEFLREGSAVHDTLFPDRIVIGTSSDASRRRLTDLYEPIVRRSSCELVMTDVQTAELIKHASNAFLATKISFINAVAEICEATGADVQVVARGMGLDPRIGPQFLDAGVGYGGSCFPKDVAAFAALARSVGNDFPLLEEVQRINERGPRRVLDKLRDELWHLKDKRIAVLGLAFKPGTDDLREAPALKVIAQLLDEEAEVVVYDPVAMTRAKEILPESVGYASSALDAMENAHAALFVTEWKEFHDLDPREIAAALRFPIVVDGRNLFDPAAMKEAEITYISVGRPKVNP